MMEVIESTCIRCPKKIIQPAWRYGSKARKKTCGSTKCVYERNGTLEERFWAKVDKRGPKDCWLWTGTVKKAKEEYGKLWVGKVMKRANRISWEMHNGPIPEGLVVRHHCDNARCVNPAHLGIGTLQDNSRDALKRGRKFGVVKLTPDQVKTIRAALGDGRDWDEYERFGKRYGVSAGAIYHLHIRRTWKWVA